MKDKRFVQPLARPYLDALDEVADKITLVKYRVTGTLGLYEPGQIIPALLICWDSDQGRGLAFHPAISDDVACHSFEYVKKEGSYYVAADEDYVNVVDYE